MKVIGINGSPRKGWNTDLLVREALEGAASKGAETELVHLYDVRFRGCSSCFACKKKNGGGTGHCCFADELLPILGRIYRCDGLILGSPIYIGEVSSAMRAFIERFTFQFITYDKTKKSFFDRLLPVLSIYTMNVSEEIMEKSYRVKFDFYENLYERLLGVPGKTIAAAETLQTDDYSGYEMSMFDEAARKKRREAVFPGLMKKAFDTGANLL